MTVLGRELQVAGRAFYISCLYYFTSMCSSLDFRDLVLKVDLHKSNAIKMYLAQLVLEELY